MLGYLLSMRGPALQRLGTVLNIFCPSFGILAFLPFDVCLFVFVYIRRSKGGLPTFRKP